jgi:hypothetical protein
MGLSTPCEVKLVFHRLYQVGEACLHIVLHIACIKLVRDMKVLHIACIKLVWGIQSKHKQVLNQAGAMQLAR